MNKYISLDIETGGLGLETSLLTCFIAILDEKLDIVDTLDLKCKPNDGLYKVNGRAMEINGIVLGEHDKEAKPYHECSCLIRVFLEKNYQGEVFKPIGQNIKFDMMRLCEQIVNEKMWYQYVSYRTLDTGTIGGFAIELGLVPIDFKAGLGNMAEYFKVGKQEEKHTAKGDVLLNINVYKALFGLFKEGMK
jgi:DNA polymerase III alpha subunit (gram-positive type)